VRSKGEGTIRAYRSAWNQFQSWCESVEREPLANDSTETVALYLSTLADRGLAASSIGVALAAIRAAHKLAELPFVVTPRLSMVIAGITRTLGTRPRRQAAPAVPDLLRRMLAVCLPASDAMGARDRAMLLIGFGAALRRSELVALNIEEVDASERGLTVFVRRSKTDQEGQGTSIAIHAAETEPDFCPLRAFHAWMAHRADALDVKGQKCEAIFVHVSKGKDRRVIGQRLSGLAVARLVKARAEDAGLDPALFSGHSLRAGLATAAGDEGAGLADVMRQTRHTSPQTAMRYLRPADLWRNNVTRRVFR
jgi:integrase